MSATASALTEANSVPDFHMAEGGSIHCTFRRGEGMQQKTLN